MVGTFLRHGFMSGACSGLQHPWQIPRRRLLVAPPSIVAGALRSCEQIVLRKKKTEHEAQSQSIARWFTNYC